MNDWTVEKQGCVLHLENTQNSYCFVDSLCSSSQMETFFFFSYSKQNDSSLRCYFLGKGKDESRVELFIKTQRSPFYTGKVSVLGKLFYKSLAKNRQEINFLNLDFKQKGTMNFVYNSKFTIYLYK